MTASSSSGSTARRSTLDLIVVADLHMGAGGDPRTGVLDRHEPFRQDEAFAAFVDHLRGEALDTARDCRLVLLGDVLDFTFVELYRGRPGRGRLDTTEPAALAKIARIAAGHPRVFVALGRFAAAGLGVDLLPGNHDIELLRPDVRDALRQRLAVAGGRPDAAARIAFHPWILRSRGLLHAEHGHQHHDLNRIAELLALEQLDGAEELPVPVGTVLGEYLIDLGEALDTDGAPRALLDAARRRPHAAAAPTARFAGGVRRSARTMIRAHRPTRRQRYSDLLRAQAADIGLPPTTLAALDELGGTTLWSLAAGLARRGALEPLLARLVPTRSVSPYMLRAARDVDAVLRGAGTGASFYVFGHTHVATDEPLGSGPEGPRYLNPGTWSTLTRGGEGGEQLAFVRVSSGGADEAPSAALLRWDPARGAVLPANK